MKNLIRNTEYRQKILKKDILVAIFIIILPLLLNIHNYYNIYNQTFKFLGFSHTFQKNSFIFYFFIGIVKLSYVIIWFITCKNRWYKILIFLLILQAYLFVNTLNFEFGFIDEKVQIVRRIKELLLGGVLIVFILPILIILRRKFNTYNVLRSIDEKLLERNSSQYSNKWKRKDYVIFYSILILFISYFGITQYLYYLKNSSDFDNSPIGLYHTTTLLLKVLIDRMLPIIYLSIWLISCKYWWYHALVVPISVYVVQIYTVLQINTRNLDKYEYIYIIPILAIVIFMLYLLRRNTLEKIEKVGLLEEIELKINEVKNKKNP